MAEATTCVMHPFSNSTSLPTFSIENHEESAIMYGIGDSISFGRYVCEDLEWEKWSSFNNTSNNRNRYVAEAEKYSKPGSVAQKKAYFEAHFKRMAALKAAALLQQANAAAAAAAVTDHVQQIDSSIITSSHENIHVTLSSKLQSHQTNNHKQAEMVGNFGQDIAKFVVPKKQPILEDEHDLTLAPPPPPPNHKSEHDLTPPPPPPPPNHKSSQKHEIVVKDEKQEEASEIEILTHQKMTEPPLQDEKSSANEEASVKVTAVIIKRNPPLSSYMSSAIVDSRGKENSKDKILIAESAAATTVNNSVHPGKENYATPIKNSKSCDVQKKKTPLRMSINREFNRILSPVIKKLGTSSSKPSTPSKTPAPAPAPANKASMYNVPQNPPITPDLTNRGATSPSRDGSKISSPIIPNSFCLTGERSSRRKQKLEEKFNAATASEKASQPSKFKEKAEAELNKFRQSFCFKVTSSPDYYGDNGIFKSPKHKNESTQHKSPKGGRQPNNNKSALPPRKQSLKPHIGLRSKRTTTLPTS